MNMRMFLVSPAIWLFTLIAVEGVTYTVFTAATVNASPTEPARMAQPSLTAPLFGTTAPSATFPTPHPSNTRHPDGLTCGNEMVPGINPAQALAPGPAAHGVPMPTSATMGTGDTVDVTKTRSNEENKA